MSTVVSTDVSGVRRNLRPGRKRMRVPTVRYGNTPRTYVLLARSKGVRDVCVEDGTTWKNKKIKNSNLAVFFFDNYCV